MGQENSKLTVRDVEEQRAAGATRDPDRAGEIQLLTSMLSSTKARSAKPARDMAADELGDVFSGLTTRVVPEAPTDRRRAGRTVCRSG